MTFRSLAILLVAAGLSLGQPPAKKENAPKEPAKPAPGSLEDTLEKVLRHSADIKAAQAKVLDAEAQLNQVRHQVLVKATALHTDLDQAKRMVAVLEVALREQMKLYETKMVTREAVLAAEVAIQKQKGEIEKLEAQLKALRGEFAFKVTSVPLTPDSYWLNSLEGTVHVWGDAASNTVLLGGTRASDSLLIDPRGKAAAAVQTPMADRVRKLLNQEIEFDAKSISIADAFKWLLDQSKTDIPYRDLVKNGDEGTLTLKGKMPLGAWFQALEDSDPKVCIVVRDYGLLMTKKERMPASAVSASELWKAKEAKKDESKPAEKK